MKPEREANDNLFWFWMIFVLPMYVVLVGGS